MDPAAMRAAVIDLLRRLDELEDPEEEEQMRVELSALLGEFPPRQPGTSPRARPGGAGRS